MTARDERLLDDEAWELQLVTVYMELGSGASAAALRADRAARIEATERLAATNARLVALLRRVLEWGPLHSGLADDIRRELEAHHD